jgi:hypothetical protein
LGLFYRIVGTVLLADGISFVGRHSRHLVELVCFQILQDFW